MNEFIVKAFKIKGVLVLNNLIKKEFSGQKPGLTECRLCLTELWLDLTPQWLCLTERALCLTRRRYT
jgi:hypothetical protein